MPATASPEELAAAPSLSAVPSPATPAPIANPVISDDGLKAMAAKFRENWKPTPATPSTQPDPSKLSPAATPATPAPAADPAAPAAATPPAPTAPATATPEDPDIAPDAYTRGQLSRRNWEKLHASRNDIRGQLERERRERESLSTRAKQLEEDLAKLRTAVPADLDALKAAAAERDRLAKEHDAAIAQLETFNLERSPRFQSWWHAETDKHVKLAQRVVAADKRDQVAKLLMQPSSSDRDTQLEALLADASEPTKRTIYGSLSALDAAKLQRDEALTRGSEHWRQLQETERQEQLRAQQAATQRRTQLAEAALARARQFTAFQTITGDEAHNAEIRQREEFVRGAVAGTLDEDVATAIPAAAVEYLHLANKVVPELRAELAKRDELIRALQNATPSPSGGTSSIPPQEENKGTSFASAVRKAMGR